MPVLVLSLALGTAGGGVGRSCSAAHVPLRAHRAQRHLPWTHFLRHHVLRFCSIPGLFTTLVFKDERKNPALSNPRSQVWSSSILPDSPEVGSADLPMDFQNRVTLKNSLKPLEKPAAT